MKNTNRCMGAYDGCKEDNLDFVLQDASIPNQPRTAEIAVCHHCGRVYRREVDNRDKVFLLSTPNKGDAYGRTRYHGREVAA